MNMGKEMYVPVLVVVAMLACVVHGCTKLQVGARHPDHTESDQRKIYYTEVIVYGHIGKQVTGRKYPNRGVSGVSNVEFDVSCVYLGGKNIPDKIVIAGMGNAKGQLPDCPPSPIDKTQGAVMFLKRTDDAKIFEVEFKPNYGDPELILDDLSINCGLTLNETRYPECRDFPPLSEEDLCVTYTTTPPPKPPTTPSTPVPPTKKGAVVVDNNTGKQKDEGYETKGNVDASKDVKDDDPENGAVTQTGSLVACFSTLFLILLSVL